jgi:hypothetical protein
MIKTQNSLLVIVLVFVVQSATAQIATIDITKAQVDYEKEVMFFFHNNWKPFREEALKANYISGYQLIRTQPDSTGLFNVILITQFADSLQFKNVEGNFRPIMKRLSPNGPKMLNGVLPKEFIESSTGFSGIVVAENKKKS